MGSTMHSLHFAITTTDPDSWTPWQRSYYEEDQEHVVYGVLKGVMEEAANKFIAENPQMFKTSTIS